jgi:hypothetical protein
MERPKKRKGVSRLPFAWRGNRRFGFVAVDEKRKKNYLRNRTTM